MYISMPRGDYRNFKFKPRNKDGTDADVNFDEIYITFKISRNITEMLFQKRLSNGDITTDEEGYYHFSILPEDTEELSFKTYYFDIELYKEEPLLKQTIVGKLELTDEITHKENEV